MRYDSRRIIGPWTIRDISDWGKYRAIALIRDGYIISASLEKRGVIKHVCFGHGSHIYGWLPTREGWIADLAPDGRKGVPRFGGVPEFNLERLK